MLLVSGEPHPGSRVWRNILKSDTNVDLVHFTILRPPDKMDGVPVDELALIAFPTEALFEERIEDFDLIIFDRYSVRGILPSAYFDNIRRYVENGGALLVSSGSEAASVESLHLSPLGAILPGRPTGRFLDAPFLPQLTGEGRRHPVTAALPEHRELADYRGLARSRPGLGLALLVALLGLVGTPPLAVFVGKLTTATAAWDGGHGWLALVVMLSSVLSLFYYLRWFAPVFARPEQHAAGFPGRGGAAAWPAVTAGVAAVASLVLGVLAGVLWAALEGPVVM